MRTLLVLVAVLCGCGDDRTLDCDTREPDAGVILDSGAVHVGGDVVVRNPGCPKPD